MGQPTVAEVKQQARTLGADLVGIASAEAVRENPVPGCPHTLEDMLAGARSAVVAARRLLWGMTREPDPANRNVHYAGELALTRLEELCYDLAAFLEDNGQPSIALPAAYSRSHQVDLARQTLSLPHLAVEAGLGTLGLNLQLLTREFGPRVILGAVVTRAALEPDAPLQTPLCLGEACGRCLLACPGDAIGHWELDLDACRPHSSPYGYHFLQRHVGRILNADDPDERYSRIGSTDTFMVWQSMLRGVGIYTGCTRCYDVCPVGEDYDAHLREVQEDIAERTPEKEKRLEELRRARGTSAGRRDHARWIAPGGATS